MCRCRCDNCFRLAESAIDLLELFQKTRESAGADRYVLADLDVTLAKGAGNNLHPLACVGIFDPEQILRQKLTKALMNLANALRSYGAGTKSAFSARSISTGWVSWPSIRLL